MLLAWLFSALSLFLHYPQVNWVLLVLIPRRVCLCMFQGPVGLSSALSCEAGSFSCSRNPHRFSQPEVLRLSFPTPAPWAVQSVLLPSCSSWAICIRTWGHQTLPHLFSPSAATLTRVLSTPLPVSALPTGLVECFFYNFLVVRLPYSSLFWQFWLFFVFKFVVVLLLVVGGGKVYLPMPPPQPEVSLLYLISDGTFSMLLRSSLNPLSILITSVLNSASDRLFSSILFSFL